MKTYTTTVTIEAEQFLPEEKVPSYVFSDGRGSPLTDDRFNWMTRTINGAEYIYPGDYVVFRGEDIHLVRKDIFEKLYTESEPTGA